jgi:hypothetical protein
MRRAEMDKSLAVLLDRKRGRRKVRTGLQVEGNA